MSEFREFQGKSLDLAIEEACRHFELDRGKLEIEIISGGSSGIFGLVGVKKACVKARPRGDFRKHEADRPAPVSAPEATPVAAPAASAEAPAPAAQKSRNKSRERGPSRGKGESRPDSRPEAATRPEPAPQRRPEPQPEPAAPAADLPALAEEHRPAVSSPAPSLAPPQSLPLTRSPSRMAAEEEADHEAGHETSPALGLAEADLDDEDLHGADELTVDPQLAEDTVREVLLKVLAPIVENPTLKFSREGGRVDVFIDDEENSGLIIGREGQTLAAIQYLVNRIVCRKLQATVRVQIDTGDYRERQNDGLRRLATQLAERVKRFGRPQSTKPLSSYHRRVVHMALQADAQIQTRSKGEGPMKKVLILPKRRPPQRQERKDEPRA